MRVREQNNRMLWNCFKYSKCFLIYQLSTNQKAAPKRNNSHSPLLAVREWEQVSHALVYDRGHGIPTRSCVVLCGSETASRDHSLTWALLGIRESGWAWIGADHGRFALIGVLAVASPCCAAMEMFSALMHFRCYYRNKDDEDGSKEALPFFKRNEKDVFPRSG